MQQRPRHPLQRARRRHPRCGHRRTRSRSARATSARRHGGIAPHAPLGAGIACRAVQRRCSNLCSDSWHARRVAGGMGRRNGPTLAERTGGAPGAGATSGPEDRARTRPVVQRHCWVQGLPDAPGRWPGLLAEWRQAAEDGGRVASWEGRVVYAVTGASGACVLVEAWLAAGHLSPGSA